MYKKEKKKALFTGTHSTAHSTSIKNRNETGKKNDIDIYIYRERGRVDCF